MRKDRNSGRQRASVETAGGKEETEGEKKMRPLIGRKSMLVEIDDER